MNANYKDLEIYKSGYRFVIRIYKLFDRFPDEEKKNLVLQLRRAAASIVINIVEGASTKTDREFMQFLNYSFRSAKEVEAILNLSHDLGFIKDEDYKPVFDELDGLQAKLYAFLQSVERRIYSRRIKQGRWQQDMRTAFCLSEQLKQTKGIAAASLQKNKKIK